MKTFFLSFLAALSFSFFEPQPIPTGNGVNPKSEIVNPKSTRAVVVGISTQQDSLLPSLAANHQNAEVYAAFLRSREGGLLPADHVQLLTGEQATMASFTAAIGWLDEESEPGDHITLYFAGNARLLKSDDGPVPHLFLTDSPLALGRAGSMPLARTCYLIQEISSRKNLKYSLVFDLNMASTTAEEDEIWRQWLDAIHSSFPFALLEETLNKPQSPKQPVSGFSPILLDGLLGEADINGNELVSPKEVGKHLRSQLKKAPGGYAMLLAFSDEKTPVSSFDATQRVKRNAEKSPNPFSALVSRELSNLEDSLLAAADGRTRQWYQDFILTMKLGKLMEPAGRCTSDLYDSLLTQISIRPLHSHLRRQLAASLQDETQQVLNDYLRTDTRELQRRWKHGGNYAAYPAYMARTVDLLGEKHFMNNIIQCKRYYFEGLTARLDFEKYKDSSQLLQTAMEKQLLALRYEPEAPFVLNELGILHFLLKSGSAKPFYLQAINLAPQWGIPYLNIAVLHNSLEQFDSALVYAQLAVDLTPWNPVAVSTLGLVNLKLRHFAAAEFWLHNAASIDQQEASIYYNLGCLKALQGETSPAFQWLELAFKYGFTDIEYLRKDKDLTTIIDTKQFNDLLKKHFPGQAKD